MTVAQVVADLQPLLEQFRADAVETDRSGLLPKSHLQQLGQIGLYRLALPVERGGLAAPADILWEVTESLAAACATTHFVQAQHQGGLGFLLRSANQQLLHEAYLDGRRFCGVAFAHLRRAQSPLHVAHGPEGYRLEGEAPWMTGWQLMDDVVLAGRDDQGQDIYLLAELGEAAIEAVPSPLLSAIQASNTVALRVRGLQLSQQRWVLSQTLEEMARRDFRSQLGYAALPLGLVREACRWIDSKSVLQRLRGLAAGLRQRALGWQGDEQEALDVRSGANQLALQAAQAAVVSVGGVANQLYHPAGRLLREASFCFLTQLNGPLRQAALERLSRLD